MADEAITQDQFMARVFADPGEFFARVMVLAEHQGHASIDKQTGVVTVHHAAKFAASAVAFAVFAAWAGAWPDSHQALSSMITRGQLADALGEGGE